LLALQNKLWLNAKDMTNHNSEDTAQQRTYRAFETLVSGDDSEIDLLQAALLIASIEYPKLDMAQCTAQLDKLVCRVREVLTLPTHDVQPDLPADLDPLIVIDAINHVLFEEEHFHGSRKDYYNPENSFFNKVLERRIGIPITLSLLYIEVSKRVGLNIEGIALPYQFIVRYRFADGLIAYIDPYEEGALLSEDACKQRILRMSRGRMKVQQDWFEPVSQRMFLARILNNLKHIYLDKEDYEHALKIYNLLLILVPHYAYEWRDRGVINLYLKHYARARHDFNIYLELEPQADDTQEINNYLRIIRQMIAKMN
jgi:regulator of sirC expression with transglutaminase-like and TPR domain